MKAFTYNHYGPPEVLHLQEVDKPTPKPNEILIRIHATTVSSGDWRMRSLEVPAGFGLIIRLVAGIRRPRQPILGTELAGVVEAVGGEVSLFKVGDPVVGFSDTALGCHAEYRCLPEDGAVAAKPSTLSFEEAAALCFGGTTALDFLRRAKLQPGERVLINGASGSVGTAAVQLARHIGAEVTGVCSTANLDLVRSLGATHVIDYTQQDFTQNGNRYDVIMDAVGTAPFKRCRRSLKPGGRLLLLVADLPAMLLSGWQSLISGRRVIAGPATVRPEDVATLADLAETGAYRPVMDRCYPFEQMVAAHRYVDTGRKRGNVVVRLDPGPQLDPEPLRNVMGA
ncbi:NAD(P)-dependent alcohol dehydrogenase [Synechococcus sp. CCY9202]|uniref:NAD(P)-dependent alcohol dehydrogenase n=1 Tax=Synechococcus sp. CCY9202 TaxID=174698 RepID=UPI002B21CBC1|nr:NAD(P)-dependent alcohol dehydrogenase [Synechococcus sp. CCY9202]MEA5421943.1 NAD(P)-dependent alcohol dehydrogenase [Synechococcus sp. CCY9202]